MATTPNYGWVTPAPTDFVTDLPADFEIFADAVDASFQADEGDLLVGGTSNIFEALPIGAAGTVLTSDGDTAEWVAAAGGGKVLQVIEGTTSTTVSIATNTYTDTNITATITPSAASSKILIMVSAPVSLIRDEEQNSGGMRLVRDSTTLTTNDTAVGFKNISSTSFEIRDILSLNYLDDPNSTSALTYKIQGNTLFTANTATIRYNYPDRRSSIILMEIGA